MADIVKTISNKKVEETVADSATQQQKELDSVKSSSTLSTLISSVSSIVSKASNAINQTVSGISSSINDSVKNFSNSTDIALKTTLTDLSKKHGSMVGDVKGQTNDGAVALKPTYIVNSTDASINSTSMLGKNGTTDGLIKSFSSNDLSKLASATGMSGIGNNSSLTSAINSQSGTFSSLTSGAKSIMSTVAKLPSAGISALSNSTNSTLKSITSSIGSSVSSLANKAGIGDIKTLTSDLYSIYKFGKSTYNLVSGKDGAALYGITSQFNNSFTDVQQLMGLATNICRAMNGNNLNNYATNKDMTDLLLYRMSQQGMYGAVDNLMNCQDSQQYIDDRTYLMLAQQMSDRANVGDVDTAYGIQKYLGRGYTSNPNSMMYNLAYNMNDTPQNRTTYMQMMSGMGVDGRSLTGNTYTTQNGQQVYIYSGNSTNQLYRRNPTITDQLTGGNGALVSTIASLFK